MAEEETEKVGTKLSLSENSSALLDGTDTVGYNSDARENVHYIKAVNQGGLPVDIVSFSVREEFVAVTTAKVIGGRAGTVPRVIYNSPASAIEHVKFEPEPKIENKFQSEIQDICMFAIDCVPKFELTYQSPSGNLYRHDIRQKRISQDDVKRPYESTDFLMRLYREVSMSGEHDTIRDISERNPISANLHPDNDLSDGSLSIGDESLEVSAKQVRTGTTNTETMDYLEFFSLSPAVRLEQRNSKVQRYGNYKNREYGNWYWGHVSDIREDSAGETVFVTVKTPLNSTVVPFTVNHQMSENTLWSLIDEAGDLQDIRGMDVCVRRRAPLVHELYKLYSSDRFEGGFNYKEVEQPNINVSNRSPLLTYENCSVEPVGIGADYVWDIGIPSESKFESRHDLSKSEDSQTGLAEMYSSLKSRLLSDT